MRHVAEVVAAHLPDYRVDSVRRLGEGQENVAYEVNGDLIVRFSKRPDPARLDAEARVLATVAAVSPVPVPRPVFTGADCLAYRKLPGVPLIDLPRRDGDTQVAATLGDLLAALHAVPLERVADLVEPDDQPLADWRDEAADLYPTVAGHVPAAHRAAVEAFLAAAVPPAAGANLFSHNDLGIEHVLVDPDTSAVTGVIDWTDAAIVDPAYDFGLILRDLGPAALAAATNRHPAGESVHDRARFYARCGLIEDLAYGVETGRRVYVTKSLTALAWLFPPRG